MTKKEFIERAKKIHKNVYDYTFVKYVNNTTKVKIICLLHNIEFFQIPKTHLNGHSGCIECANIKKKQTNLERFGVEHALKLKKYQDKQKRTCLKRYGVEYASQSEEIKEKTKQTNLERFGAEYASQSEEIKEKTKQTNLERYDVPCPLQSNKIKEKTKQTNLERYGAQNYKQSHFASDVLCKLNDQSWLYNKHIKSKKSLIQIANELNVSECTVGNYLHHYNIETQNYFSSTGEKEVLNFVETLNITTISNTRKIIPPYELDVYIPSHNLAIEYCGLYWHSEQAGKDKNYHEKKFNLCKALGIQLITIFEDEWFNRQEQVKSKLKSLLHKDESDIIYARKTQIIKVSKQSKKTFFEKNHIQRAGLGSINIGLIYNNKLVSCMSFIKTNDDYELSRYATSCRVIGGFSKLLKHFINEYEPKSIISFADLRWSIGNLYTKTGWVVDKILPPDYSYSPDAKQRIHKFNYRRKNLSKLLENFDSNLSEKINCNNNGILRIWDCGKIRFKYTPLDY